MKRLYSFLIVMGVFAAAYQAGSMSMVSEEEASIFMSAFEELVLDIDAVGIFAHNLTIALPMFIPGAGIAWGLFSATMTGYAFAAISVANPDVAGIPALSILFLTPFGLMEVAAYSLAMSRSLILVHAIVKRRELGPQMKPTLAEIGIVAGLLLAGGFVEHYLISAAEELALDLVPG